MSLNYYAGIMYSLVTIVRGSESLRNVVGGRIFFVNYICFLSKLIPKSGCHFREEPFLLITAFKFCIFFPSATPAGILGATTLTLGTSIEPPSTTISGGNGASSILPPGGIGLGVKPPSPEQPLFMCPRRPNIGREVSFLNI